jgi:hypothetical protein
MYSGSVLGEHVLDEIDLGGLGRVLAATPNDWINVLAVQRFSRVFGRPECYQLPPQSEEAGKKAVHRHLHGRWLFGSEITYVELERRVAAGATIKATPISESFQYTDFQKLYGQSAIPLFLITKDGELRIGTDEKPLAPQPGQTLVGLVSEPPSKDGRNRDA